MKKIVLFVSILISSMIGADVTNSIGMVFKEIPASKGMKSFYVAETEVTQAQWVQVMGSNPSFFNSKMYNLPVDSIDAKSALEFIKRLNLKENTKVYRLLTKKEFEHVATDGKGGSYTCVDPKKEFITFLSIFDYKCVNSTIVYNQLAPNPVKSKQPNKFGVYDMYGNAKELILQCQGQNCEPFVIGGSWKDELIEVFSFQVEDLSQMPTTPEAYFEKLYISHANKGYNQDRPIDLGFRIVKDKQ